jgi:deoxycytidylate deaminase
MIIPSVAMRLGVLRKTLEAKNDSSLRNRNPLYVPCCPCCPLLSLINHSGVRKIMIENQDLLQPAVCPLQ